MRPTRFVAIAGLSLGCPLFIWASTLSSSASCRIDGDRLVTARNRTELAPLLLLMGLAQGAIAVALMRKPSKANSERRLSNETPAVAGSDLPFLPPIQSGELEDLEEPQEDVYGWADDLDGYPSILIFGPQGSGKTSFASWLMHRRIANGHAIEVCDPHRECGQWDGLKVYGDGMNYEQIDENLRLFIKRVKARYQQRASTPGCKFKKLTMVCDEFTQWSAKCSNAAEFFETALSDIRKVEMHVIFISHARTMSALGGAKGLAKTRDAGLLEVELFAKVDPVTKKASPKLEGNLKFPGGDSRPIKIATYMKGDMSFKQPESRPNNVVPLKVQDRAVTTVDTNSLEVTDGSY